MTIVVHQNKLYVANSGDCGGILCRQEDGSITPIKINQRFNAATKKEKARLKSQFTDDNIVVCKGVNILGIHQIIINLGKVMLCKKYASTYKIFW